MKRDVLEELRKARQQKRSVALLTNLKSDIQYLSYLSEDMDNSEITSALDRAFRTDRSGVVDTKSGPVFIRVFNPPLRMIVVGAVHIAQALAPMAAMTGYEVTVVDPRRSFASDSRFPDLDVRTDWPDEALTDIALDHRTAVVALTHDPKLDDPALSVALRSPCFYIGALGSTRTHAARLRRLAEGGFDETEVARIHGPIGLDIGAKSPAEIAIAIMAQVTEKLRQGTAQ